MLLLKRLIVLLCLVSLFFLEKALFTPRSEREELNISNLVNLPLPLSKALVLNFQSMASNFVFLNTLTYMGEKVLYLQQTTSDEWQKIFAALDLGTYLDPRSTDPYVLAETTLPWEAGMVDETNQLLKRAAEYRPDDYRPNFYLWFNHFYFKQDPETAGPYLEKAAKHPASPKYFAPLAARMKVYSGQYPAAIHFLETILAETQDEKRREVIELRLDALRKLAYLENAVHKYKTEYNTPPEDLSELVSKKIIESIPIDPYDGEFYIMDNGRVYTTSELAFSKK